VPIAKALIDDGFEIMEITMHTEYVWYHSHSKGKRRISQMLVGAGTMLSVEKVKEARKAGYNGKDIFSLKGKESKEIRLK